MCSNHNHHSHHEEHEGQEDHVCSGNCGGEGCACHALALEEEIKRRDHLDAEIQKLNTTKTK